jgi:hypothetical protein
LGHPVGRFAASSSGLLLDEGDLSDSSVSLGGVDDDDDSSGSTSSSDDTDMEEMRRPSVQVRKQYFFS